MDISIHDNHIVFYSVDCEKREILFHTISEGVEPVEHTNVIFERVVAYHFEGDNFSNILYDIYEEPLDIIYDNHLDLFENGLRFNWPDLEVNSPKESLLQYLCNEEVKGYLISSSYGLRGWVWAKSMSKRAA